MTTPDTVRFVVTKGKATVDEWVIEVGDSVVAVDPDGPLPDDAVTFTLTPGDADAYRNGTLDLSVGFMRGQVKMAGDFGVLLRVLPRLRALQVS
jgi:hypothetical protein